MKIKGEYKTRRIWINNCELLPAASQKVHDHSPDGFAWGYGGSGPAQLALAILLSVADQKTALAYHQHFKCEFVAEFPKQDFTLDIKIREYLAKVSGKQNQPDAKEQETGKPTPDPKPDVKASKPTVFAIMQKGKVLQSGNGKYMIFDDSEKAELWLVDNEQEGTVFDYKAWTETNKEVTQNVGDDQDQHDQGGSESSDKV